MSALNRVALMACKIFPVSVTSCTTPGASLVEKSSSGVVSSKIFAGKRTVSIMWTTPFETKISGSQLVHY